MKRAMLDRRGRAARVAMRCLRYLGLIVHRLEHCRVQTPQLPQSHGRKKRVTAEAAIPFIEAPAYRSLSRRDKATRGRGRPMVASRIVALMMEGCRWDATL